MNGRETVAAYIAKRRKHVGMSQEQLAEALRVTRTVVSRWETGQQRPTPDQLDDLTRVLDDDDGHLASLARHEDDGDRPPRFDPPVRVGDLLRRAGDALIGFMSTEVTPDGEAPGYGWRHDLGNPDKSPSAWATANALRSVSLSGSLDRRVSLPLLRRTLRTFELPSGGWTVTSFGTTARPEVTAAVARTMRDAGEDADYVAERVRVVIDLLDHREPGAERVRPFVLATSLIELSRLDVEDAVGRRLVEILVDVSRVNGDARGWPLSIWESTIEPKQPSTVHTALAVFAAATWAERLDDPGLGEVARAGVRWLQQHATLDLDDEDVSSIDGDGHVDRLTIRHFTSAWVVQAALAAGADPGSHLVDRAMRDVLDHFVSEVGIWRWPRGGIAYPTWMTYHGAAALAAWASAHRV